MTYKHATNCVAAKERRRIERASSPLDELPVPKSVHKIKASRFAVKINLERTDGERIQFTCHRFYDKIYHNGKLMAAKNFFRRIGEIANLWSMT